MAVDKYLSNNAGVIQEVQATVQSVGSGSAGKIPGLDSSGRLDTSVMPVGIGAETILLPATEGLAAGAWVNIYNAAGTMSVRNADATVAGKEANGFVLASVTQSNNATVYLAGANTSLSSLTLGSNYFLSTTPGVGSASAPSGSGNIVQRLGKAVSATEIAFQPSDPITLA